MCRLSRKNKIYVVLTMISFILSNCFVPSGPVSAAEAGPKPVGQVVILVVDRMTWDELLKSDVPAIKQMAARGVVGLMTTNPAGSKSRVPDNTYTTIGAGAKVSGGLTAGMGLNTTEKFEVDTAGDAFYRRTGLTANKKQVVNLGIVDIDKDNEALKYRFVVGAIGTILHQNSLKTAVIGNADIPSLKPSEGNYQRQAVTIAMDNRGLVDYGNVSANINKFDAWSLAGVRTDYDRVLHEFDGLRDKANLVVIETGDTSRVNDKAGITTKEILAGQRQKALAGIDNFVSHLVNRLDLNRDLVMVVFPGPPLDAMEQGVFLTPFIMAGKGVKSGVTWSGTIKRNGLISNTDIALTVAKFFGLKPVIIGEAGTNGVTLSGQPIESRKATNSFDQVTKLYEDTVFIYNARYPLVKGYINLELVLIIACILGIALRKKAVQPMVPLLVACTVVPGVLLWVNFFPHPYIITVVFIVVGVTAAATIFAMGLGRGRPLTPYLITTGLTAVMIVVDIFAGGPLAKTSPLSYDVMSGARFYGIGNEYVGVLLGCVIVFTGLFLDSVKSGHKFIKNFAALSFLVVIYSIAAPNLGTNVGGTIAAVAGLGASGLIIWGGAVNKKSILIISTAVVLIVAFFIAYDLTRAVEAQSHIGRTMTQIKENGFSEIINIIVRKCEMNFKLIRTSTWSWFYFICLLAIPFINRLFPNRAKAFQAIYPWFNRLLAAVAMGSIFALVFNDSGIVAAATMIIFATAPYLTGMIFLQSQDRL